MTKLNTQPTSGGTAEQYIKELKLKERKTWRAIKDALPFSQRSQLLPPSGRKTLWLSQADSENKIKPCVCFEWNESIESWEDLIFFNI